MAQTKIRTLQTTGREVLTADRTYYVRTDGNDSNTGLANTSGGAFLTIQKAVNVTATLDISVYNVTISVGAGTYNVSSITLKPCVGSGYVYIKGDEATPANVVINTSDYGGIVHNSPLTLYKVTGFKLTIPSTSLGLYVYNGATLQYGFIEFTATTNGVHINVTTNASVVMIGNCTISGGCGQHIVANKGGYIEIVSLTYTISGTPAWASEFIRSDFGGIVNSLSATFTGACTGKRYNSLLNSIINTWGGGANYFPGNAAGTTATGGQYA